MSDFVWIKLRHVNPHTSACVAQVYSTFVCPFYLYIWKGHAYDEVAGPVAAASESDGRRPRSLAEQFSNYEPWNGTRTNLKETHKEEDSWHADVAHPRVFTLEERVHQSREEFPVRIVPWLLNLAWNSSLGLFKPHFPICFIILKCDKDEMVTGFFKGYQTPLFKYSFLLKCIAISA